MKKETVKQQIMRCSIKNAFPKTYEAIKECENFFEIAKELDKHRALASELNEIVEKFYSDKEGFAVPFYDQKDYTL